MQLRDRGCHVGISLIGTHHYITRLGYTEVATRHTCVGFYKLLAQMMTCTSGEICRVIVSFLLRNALFFKHSSHFFTRQMNGRHHDMTRLLAKKLDDTLT